MDKVKNETPVSIMMVRRIEVASSNPIILGLSSFHQAERIVVRTYYKLIDAPPSDAEQHDGPSQLLQKLQQ